MKNQSNQIETVLNLFMAHDGRLEVLLVHKEEEPYKGYWMLPTSSVLTTQTLEENAGLLLKQFISSDQVSLCQNHTFSELDRYPDERVMGVSFIGIVVPITWQLNETLSEQEVKWFEVNSLPKLAYDHSEIIQTSLKSLQTGVKNGDLLCQFYPADFTLPELQHFLEVLFDCEIDRRNFRKRLLNEELIEETGDKEKGQIGRPAKLYRFKEEKIAQEIG